MTTIAVRIELYGSFRRFGTFLECCVPKGSTVEQVKRILSELLDGKESRLVFDSVLADQKSIMSNDRVLDSDSELSILPPVCGG